MTPAAPVRIKGSVLRARLALVDELRPLDGRERVLERLEAEDRRQLQSLMASFWYPFELGQNLDAAIVEVVGGGRSEFFEKLGEASAEQNLRPGGVHHAFLADDPQAFLAKAPLIYSYYYDRGRREYTRVGEREAVLTTHDAETFSASDCLTVVGWYRRALAMCGASRPVVAEEECRARGGAVCRYRLTWS